MEMFEEEQTNASYGVVGIEMCTFASRNNSSIEQGLL
jgi:hypothetical protein